MDWTFNYYSDQSYYSVIFLACFYVKEVGGGVEMLKMVNVLLPL